MRHRNLVGLDFVQKSFQGSCVREVQTMRWLITVTLAALCLPGTTQAQTVKVVGEEFKVGPVTTRGGLMRGLRDLSSACTRSNTSPPTMAGASQKMCSLAALSR
jgi:hypothetical protein